MQCPRTTFNQRNQNFQDQIETNDTTPNSEKPPEKEDRHSVWTPLHGPTEQKEYKEPRERTLEALTVSTAFDKTIVVPPARVPYPKQKARLAS